MLYTKTSRYNGIIALLYLGFSALIFISFSGSNLEKHREVHGV